MSPWKLCPQFRLIPGGEDAVTIATRKKDEIVTVGSTEHFTYERLLELMHKAYCLGIRDGWENREEELKKLLKLS